MKYIKIGNKRLPVPANPALRTALGWALIVGGIFGFLPILGFWMIPLGIMILRIDSLGRFPRLWGRRKKKKPSSQAGHGETDAKRRGARGQMVPK